MTPKFGLSAANPTKPYIHGTGLLAMVTPTGATYAYHYNATGSTVALTDMSRAIVNKYSYDPYGNILQAQETIQQPFKFVGRFGVMEEATGFYYMRARYYDSQTGRFISEDPLGFGGGEVNLMAYVGGNPVNLVDPMGLDAFSTALGVAGYATSTAALVFPPSSVR
ncbi:MAG: RHS repeat-associated core domain-containing protein [Deltaproteobacteria bacterium]|nr:RHS repeat-associated core domain-containing protein [Deltaproteobacteria bacterium]